MSEFYCPTCHCDTRLVKGGKFYACDDPHCCNTNLYPVPPRVEETKQQEPEGCGDCEFKELCREEEETEEAMDRGVLVKVYANGMVHNFDNALVLGRDEEDHDNGMVQVVTADHVTYLFPAENVDVIKVDGVHPRHMDKVDW